MQTEEETLSYTITHKVETVPVFEEAANAKGNEFEYGFQHKSGGEEIVAVLQGKIQRLERESKECVFVCFLCVSEHCVMG